MATATEHGPSTEDICQAARQLPREWRIVLIEMLANNLHV